MKTPNPKNTTWRGRKREEIYHFQLGDVLIEINPVANFAPSVQAVAHKAGVRVTTQTKQPYGYSLAVCSDLAPWSVKGLVARLREMEQGDAKAFSHSVVAHVYQQVETSGAKYADLNEDLQFLYLLGRAICNTREPAYGIHPSNVEQLNDEFGLDLEQATDGTFYRRHILFGHKHPHERLGHRIAAAQEAIKAAPNNTILVFAESAVGEGVSQWAREPEQDLRVVHRHSPAIIYKGDKGGEDRPSTVNRFADQQKGLPSGFDLLGHHLAQPAAPDPEDTEDVEDLI